MEDKNLLAGYVAMTLRDFNLAQVRMNFSLVSFSFKSSNITFHDI